MRPIVFLHIPKTAGQTIHHALAALVGRDNVSPIRVNEQAKGGTPLPPGYLLHSGHLDWVDLEKLGGDPFVFSVLRDPRERIGSLYFYMLKTSRAASEEEVKSRQGLSRIRDNSADDYFFGGDEKWQSFVRNSYDNFYCSYFATRRFGGRKSLGDLDKAESVQRALEGSKSVTRIYNVEDLSSLEDDIEQIYDQRIEVVNRRNNTGDQPEGQSRWELLRARFESDSAFQRLENYVTKDEAFLKVLFGPSSKQSTGNPGLGFWAGLRKKIVG